MARVITDCRSAPNVVGCTLTIAGEEEEVLACAVEHAIAVHGHERTPELRDDIRQTLEPEETRGGAREEPTVPANPV